MTTTITLIVVAAAAGLLLWRGRKKSSKTETPDTESSDPRDLWKALDDGRDPTQ